MRVFCSILVAMMLLSMPVTAQPAAPQPVTASPMDAVPAMVAPEAPPAMVSEAPPAMAPEAPPAVSAPTAVPTVTVQAPEPIWKSPGFWISVVGGPLLSIILGILVAFGVVGQKQIDFLKRHKIVEIADKVVTQFEKFAADTKPKWDDVLAQAIRAVVDRVGVLTDDQQALVKAVVEERQAQAEVKSTAEVKTEEKPVEKKPEA